MIDSPDLPAVFEALVDAMELADVEALEVLLDDGWTLRHPSGDEQAKASWLADLDAGSIEYRSIDVVETAVRPVGDGAVLTARTLTEARIHRIHAVWRMQLRIDYARRDERWVAMRAVARGW